MKITFNSQIAAENGVKKIYVNYIRKRASSGVIQLEDNENVYTSIEGMTDEELSLLKICGKNKGDFVVGKGLSEAYDQIQKASGIDLWYFEKPDEDLMSGISDYVLQEFNQAWVE